MSDNSKIEWTDATWNPVSGCTKVSQGCKNCYAETFYERFHGKGSFKNVISHHDRLKIPVKWRTPKKIFVNSMSDLFHEDVSDAFIYEVFGIMAVCVQHTFQILTKRPERMQEILSNKLFHRYLGEFDLPLDNVWLGVSVEDQKTADERIPILISTPAAKRFLSCEPLLGAIDVFSTKFYKNGIWSPKGIKRNLHWVIAGGESGYGARPMHPDWVRSLRDQCKDVGVDFFFKQWGEWLPASEDYIKDSIKNWCWVNKNNGCVLTALETVPSEYKTDDYCMMQRLGKKKAGNVLDGVTHLEFPEVPQINT